jgi:hypothetical protein
LRRRKDLCVLEDVEERLVDLYFVKKKSSLDIISVDRKAGS